MIIKREIKKEITEHISKKEITIITGARQTGKTTLLNEIKTELEETGEKVLFLNLDNDSHLPYFKSQDKLLQKAELEIGNQGFVFIDEIQRLENAGLFIKGIYDRNTRYKLVLTGSGSIELKQNIQESLAGRKRLFEMTPVNFFEFTDYKTGYRYEDKLPLFFDTERELTQTFLEEYLNYGGYPQVVTESLVSEKIKLIDEIFRSYVEKDLVYLLKVERPETFKLLIKILAAQNGNLINYSELSKQVNLSVPTLKKYLWYAEKTFCIHYVSPFFRNHIKEITKSPIYFFNDLGLRNYSLDLMGKLLLNQQLGFNFQNLIFFMLRDALKWKNRSLHFWRTTDKAEVDFVINSGSNQLLPIEVKYGNLNRPTVSRSFRNFIDKYSPEKALIINRSLEEEIYINQAKVTFIPYYKIPEWLGKVGD